MTAVFRYFDIRGIIAVGVQTRGSARGQVEVRTEAGGAPVGTIEITPSRNWTWHDGAVKIPDGVCELYLTYTGRGSLDLLEIRLG